MSETNNKIIGVMSDRREGIIKKAKGLNGLLLAATVGAEHRLELDENSMIILADIAYEIANSIPCLSPFCNEGQDRLMMYAKNLMLSEGRAWLNMRESWTKKDARRNDNTKITYRSGKTVNQALPLQFFL